MFARLCIDDGADLTVGLLGNTVSEGAAAVELVDHFETEIVEYLLAEWPVCPGHAHAMSALVREGEAVWCCPASNEAMSEIGHLGI